MIRYHLDDLGWYQFEWLCQAILKNMLGSAVDLGGSGDWGRDAYCESGLRFGTDTPVLVGPHVFQCKFVEAGNAAGAEPKAAIYKAIAAECSRIKERQYQGIPKPKSLIFITNARLEASERADIKARVKAKIGSDHVLCWDGNDVCGFIDNAPSIRQSFPQLLTVRDIDALLHDQLIRGARQRSNISLERAKELLPMFVPTRAHHEALACLQSHNFVILAGPPEAGKTAIASMIALQKAAEGWEFFDCPSPSDFFETYDAEKSQVFFADDLFGQTEYSPTKGDLWAPELEKVLCSLNVNHWFVFTSRTTPLKLALRSIEFRGPAAGFADESAVIVDCRHLSMEERALMLFKHARGTTLDDEQKSLIRMLAPVVVGNAYLTPERIRRFVQTWLNGLLADFLETRQTDRVKKAVSLAIRQPTDRMSKSFSALPPDHQLFLFACLNHELAISVDRVAESATKIFHRDLRTEPKKLVADLTDHFLYLYTESVRHSQTGVHERVPHVNWIHPSWRDLIIDSLAISRQQRKAFLTNCDSPGLELAVSAGGGADGNRQCPLIIDSEDANLFAQSFKRACVTSYKASLAVLKSFVAALKAQQLADSLVQAVRSVLPEIVQLWDAERVVSVEELERFYQLCNLLSTTDLHPHFWLTWRDAWRPVIEAEKSECYDDHIDDFARQWNEPIKLWYLLKTQRAALFLKADREEPFVKYVLFFLRSVQEYLSDVDPETRSEADQEFSRIEGVKDVLGDLAGIFKSIDGKINETNSDLRWKQQELDELDLPRKSEPGFKGAAQNHPMNLPSINLDLLFSSL